MVTYNIKIQSCAKSWFSRFLLICHPAQLKGTPNLKCSLGLIVEYSASWVYIGAIAQLRVSVNTIVAMIKCLCLIAIGSLVAAHPQDFLSAIGGKIKIR